MLIKREAFKTFYNALIQKMKDFRGNWDQNDPAADDYIKNRPFYTEHGVEVTVLPETSFEPNSISNNVCAYSFTTIQSLEVGKSYNVIFNGETYSCVGYENANMAGFVVLGNIMIISSMIDTTGATDTGEPFLFISQDGNAAYIYTSTLDVHTIQITSTGEIVHKIDEKYLPDLPTMDYVGYNEYQNLTEDQMTIARENIGAGTSNFSGRYSDLTNKPTIYTDVVRYGTTQSLDDTQKAKARSNMGAISSDEAVSVTVAQTLTDRQKELARANIGVSAFDGSFESLTDVPSLMTLDTEQNATARKVLNFGQHQSVDGQLTGLEINTCMWKGTDGEVNYHTLLGNGSLVMERAYADGTSHEMMISPGIIASGMDTIQFQRYHASSGQSVRIINLKDPVDYYDATTKRYVDNAIAAMKPKSTSITLPAAAWTGDANPYSQVVTVSGVTANSKVDLQPTAVQIVELQDADIAFMTENNDGVITVYAIGGKPEVDYTMQVLITEVVPV